MQPVSDVIGLIDVPFPGLCRRRQLAVVRLGAVDKQLKPAGRIHTDFRVRRLLRQREYPPQQRRGLGMPGDIGAAPRRRPGLSQIPGAPMRLGADRMIPRLAPAFHLPGIPLMRLQRRPGIDLLDGVVSFHPAAVPYRHRPLPNGQPICRLPVARPGRCDLPGKQRSRIVHCHRFRSSVQP